MVERFVHIEEVVGSNPTAPTHSKSSGILFAILYVMTLITKRFIFWFFWLLFILSAPITVLMNSSIDVVFSNQLVLMNFFQRITGLLAFNLLFMQIILGSQMNKWIQLIGAKAYRIHIFHGLVTYGFMFIHPFFENIIVYQVSKSLTESMLIFIPSLETQRDILLVFGRVAFLLTSISVIAAYFRTKPFFRRNWRAFHILNYLVFYLVFIHMRLGTDITTPPFSWLSWLAFIGVSLTLVNRALNPLFLKLHLQKDIKKVR